MKRWIATLLALAMLTVGCGGAFADTLRLPASMTVVEEEAFSGNPALDEVEVSWGTEAIESRAFAGSGVRRIFIPATVTYIADDAFEGTNVTIRAAADSYAREYADAHGLAWEDSLGGARREAMEMLEDAAAMPRGGEAGPLPLLDRLPTEGIDDPGELSRIADFNEAVDSLNGEIESYNQRESEVGQAIADSIAGLPMVTVTEADSQVRMTVDDMTLVMDDAVMRALERGVEVVSAEGNGDGLTTLTMADGAKYYMYQSGSSFYYTRTAPAALAVSNGDLAVANDWLEDFTNKVDNIENVANNIDSVFDNGLANIEADIRSVEESLEYLNAHQELTNLKTDVFRIEMRVELRERLKSLQAKRVRWQVLKRIWSGIDIFANILILRQIIINWHELDQIDEHGHPNGNDASAASLDLVGRMNRDIRSLRVLYTVDGMSSAIQMLGSLAMLATLVPSGGAAVITERAFAVIKTLAGVILNIMEDDKLESIREIHGKLHTYVYGWVTDQESGRPLAGILVTDGLVGTFTDDTGYYELYIPPDGAMGSEITLIFTPDGDITSPTAVKVPMQVMLITGEGARCDAVIGSGIVQGRVTSATYGGPLGGVTVNSGETQVTTDPDGYYSISLGQARSLHYSVAGYEYELVNIRPFEGVLTLDIAMNATITFDYMSEETIKSITKGRVYDAVTHQPLSGVMIRSGGIGTFTDAAGSYELYLVTGRTSSVSFQLEGYQDWRTIIHPAGAWSETTMNVYLQP